MIGHRIWACLCCILGDIAQGRDALDQAIALYDPAEHRALGDALWRRRLGCQLLAIESLALWVLGYPDGRARRRRPRGQVMRARSAKPPLDVRAGHHIVCLSSSAEITRQQRRNLMKLSRWRTQKGSLFWKAFGMCDQGCALGVDGQSRRCCANDHRRDGGMAVNGSNAARAVVSLVLGNSLCGTRSIR